YETFLAAYDPKQRKACGVYYTPEPIVSFLVRTVDDLLMSCFRIPEGLAGGENAAPILVLDPACGTGSFLAAVIGRSRSPSVRRCLLPRLLGFELLPVPFAVAQLQLSQQGATDGRLEIHQTNHFEDMAEK